MSEVTTVVSMDVTKSMEQKGLDKVSDWFSGTGKITDNSINPISKLDYPIPNQGDHLHLGVLPANNGKWSGEKGNSTWIPDREVIPDPENGKGGNPDKLTWKEILEKYSIDGIEFKDGEPDFSPVKEAEVKIGDFTTDRYRNFAQADQKLAEEKGVSPREIREWREKDGLTWHECKDCKTMQLVPTEVHNNVSHEGGISVKKQEQSDKQNAVINKE